MSKDKGSKLNLFGGGDDLATVANEIYGGSAEIPDSGRVVARPTPINSIWADVRQPRRAIPLSIRMHWNGDPADVPDLFDQWRQVAVSATGEVFDMVELLNGQGEGMNTDKFPSVAQEFVELVRLAAHIKANGLINPITVIESDGRLLIESGERRWLAHHLLHIYMGDQWAKVPAAKGNATDSIWRQAGENTQRRQLNAIGMARQLALLIMAARGTPPIANGTPYREYEEIVSAGVCDRRYYAQVADGNVHRIPRGMGERIQGAMALSETQLARYRGLLQLTNDEQVNDALWVRADVENWAEHMIREVATLPMGKVRTVIDRDGWTLDDLRALKDVPVALPPMATVPQPVMPARRPVTSEWMHKTVVTKGNLFCKVIGVDGDWITVILPDQKRKSFHYMDLTIAADRQGSPAASPAPQPMGYGFAIGDRVRTRTGSEGEVVGLSGRLISVRTQNGTTSHDHTLLMLLPKGIPHQKPPEPVEGKLKLAIGDRVITDYGRVGTVWAIDGSRIGLRDDAGHEWVSDLNSTPLRLYDVPQITEAMIEPDVDPDAPKAAPEWREGWTEGESGSNLPAAGMASDKADSESGNQFPTRLFPIESNDWNALYHFSTGFKFIGDDSTAAMLTDMMNMTDLEAEAMGRGGNLDTAVDQCHKIMQSAQDAFLMGDFASFLRIIHEAGSKS